jgi:tetratricopeptide (TPR) repeat protein
MTRALRTLIAAMALIAVSHQAIVAAQAQQQAQDNPSPDSQSQAKENYAAGKDAMAKKNYVEAETRFTLAIADERERPVLSIPERIDLFFMRGNALFMQRDYAEAVKDFSQAITLKGKPSDPLAKIDQAAIFNLRSQSLLQMNKNGEALRDIDMAVELAPHISAYRRQRAITLYSVNRLDEALADLNVAIGTVSKDSFLYAFRGQIHNELGHEDLAKRDFDTASKMDKAGADLVKQFTKSRAPEGNKDSTKSNTKNKNSTKGSK